ncbi:MAG TPA: hypothetical protein VF718_14640 [Allosphingosinicella sp.]|jgi:hypothetical protein
MAGDEGRQKLNFASNAWDGVDRQLGSAVAAAIQRARGAGLVPTVFGSKGHSADAKPVEGLPAVAQQAVSDAGHHSGSLAGLRLTDLDASRLTLEHVDLLHRKALAATYQGLRLSDAVVDKMVGLGMPAWEMLDFIGPCTGTVTPRPRAIALLPIDWRRAIDRDRLLAAIGRIASPYRSVPFPLPQPRPQPGPDWHVPFADTRPFQAAEGAVDLLGVADMRPLLGQLARGPRPGRAKSPGWLLATAYGQAMKGDNSGALRIAAQAASGKDDGKRGAASYQRLVVAPAFAAAVADDSRVALAAARAALEGTAAGTAAQTIAHRAAVRSAAVEARRARSAAKAGGVGRRARKRAAIDATVRLASAEHLEGVGARRAAALTTATAMMDLYRAYAAGMNGVISTPATIRHGRPAYPGDESPSAADVLQRGASAYLGDPTLRLHAFDSFLHLHRLCLANVGCGAWDPFRFDYLAGEARKLLDDLARIDQLSVELIEMLQRAGLERIAATDALQQQLEALLERLVSDINAAAGRLRDTVAAVVPHLRELGALQAIYDLLKSWPWDNWAAVIQAIGGAFASGEDPAIAARDAIGTRMGGFLQGALGEAKGRIVDSLGQIEASVRDALENSMGTLRAELSDVLGANALGALDAALAGINFIAVAQPILDELDAADVSAEIPAWLQTLLLVYVAAPFIAALATAAQAVILGFFSPVELPFVGAVAASVCAFIATTLVQLGISLVLQLLGELLSRKKQILAHVERLLTRLRAIANDLIAALATTAMMQSALDAVNALLARLDDAFPPEINSALSDAVLAARTALRLDLGTVLKAAENSYFRETLEIVEVLPQLEDASPSGMYDPGLGYANRLAAGLSRFEADRIRTTAEPAQVLTQVLSLRQILSGTAEEVEARLAGLLNLSTTLPFDLSIADLDHVAPGLHRQLIRDVQLQVDFDLDVPLSPELTAPGGAPITKADAVAAIVTENSAIAGGLSDPALDGAVPGGGFRGLPVIAGRLPTGIPALLTHDGVSSFRIKDAQSIADAADRRSRLVTGVTLQPDPDERLAARGWKRLTICEPPQQQLFSHFRVLEDGIRFFNPDKEIHPFEFRSIAGAWALEIPAVKLGSVKPKLPRIRDVRLIFSTVARYDSGLAAGIGAPDSPIQASEPDPAADDHALDLLADPLSGLRTSLADGRAELAARISRLESVVGEGFASLTGDIGSLGEKLEDLDEISTTTAGLLLGLPSPGPAARNLRVVTLGATDAATLSGAPKAWTVDEAMLAGRGIDSAATVAWVAVTALPSAGSAVGGLLPGATAPVWPSAPATLGFAPAAGGPARTAQLLFDSPTASVDGITLGGGVPPAGPVGTWTLDLPPGMPALSEAVVALFLET